MYAIRSYYGVEAIRADLLKKCVLLVFGVFFLAVFGAFVLNYVRITSYNVCYTKLLRVRQLRRGPQEDGPLVPGPRRMDRPRAIGRVPELDAEELYRAVIPLRTKSRGRGYEKKREDRGEKIYGFLFLVSYSLILFVVFLVMVQVCDGIADGERLLYTGLTPCWDRKTHRLPGSYNFV